ncbi:MAG TPA: RNA polymerase sigma factor [Gammaproteobacteria bacterium]|nr:RNA polymerase sigma factor [Gammaproteobacteria bacterium]
MTTTTAGGRQVAERAGDSLDERFRRLLEANHAPLTRLAASYAGNRSDRDDLLQEIAIAVWRALPSLRGDCSERTFLFRIAHNRCMTHLSKRRPTVSLDEAQIDVEDPNVSAETLLAEEQQRRRFVQAIRGLPAIHREVLVLFLEGMDYGEIAAVVGISESNVGVRLNRARQRLKELLEEGT